MPWIPGPILFALVSIGYARAPSNESHCASVLLVRCFLTFGRDNGGSHDCGRSEDQGDESVHVGRFCAELGVSCGGLMMAGFGMFWLACWQ